MQKFVFCVYLRDDPPLVAFEQEADANKAREKLHELDMAEMSHASGVNYWRVKKIEVLDVAPTDETLRHLRGWD